mgnify:CR=1 FL=1
MYKLRRIEFINHKNTSLSKKDPSINIKSQKIEFLQKNF